MNTPLVQSELDYLRSISPNTVVNYLVANNWSKLKTINNELVILEFLGNETQNLKVRVPLIQNASDYDSMMYKVISTLTIVHQKTKSQIFDDLQTIAVGDVIRYHSQDLDKPNDHTIPLNDGLQIFHQLRKLAYAAAASVATKRPIHPRKPTEEVQQYLDSLRLGQTEVGSYLIKVISPISSIEKTDGEFVDFSESIPFSRRAVVELVKGLETIRNVADVERKEGKYNFDPFLEAVPRGVSANLCEALLSPYSDIDSKNDLPVKISVTWSYLIRDKSLSSESNIVIDPSTFPYIRQAAKEFRYRHPEIITLTGWVNILEKDSIDGQRNIRIIGRTPDGIKSVRVKLEPDDYDIAYESYKKNRMVSVVGELKKENSISFLENPRNLHLLSEDFLPNSIEF